MTKMVALLVSLMAIVEIAVTSAYSQAIQSSILPGTTLSQASSNYYFARPNELTIIVNVVGFVQRPGRYEISNSIDLINLLALAGGGTPDATLSDVKVTRTVEAEGRMRMKEFRVNLDDVAGLTPADLVLRQGDIIQVERSGWASFRDAFGVVVSAAIITTAVAEIIIATKR
jgi:translation initiation factor IF-1